MKKIGLPQGVEEENTDVAFSPGNVSTSGLSSVLFLSPE
jgi:hypothetical protein